MVAEVVTGGGAGLAVAESRITTLGWQTRVSEWENEFAHLANRERLVQEMTCALKRGLNARIAVRAPDPDSPKGWSYQWIPDGAVQIAAVRVGAQMLGLIKSGGTSVSVDASTKNVTVNAQDRMTELTSCAASPEEKQALQAQILKTCAELLQAEEGKTQGSGNNLGAKTGNGST